MKPVTLFGLRFEPPPPPAYADHEIELAETARPQESLDALQRRTFLEGFRRDFEASL